MTWGTVILMWRYCNVPGIVCTYAQEIPVNSPSDQYGHAYKFHPSALALVKDDDASFKPICSHARGPLSP